jgi:cytochrome c6
MHFSGGWEYGSVHSLEEEDLKMSWTRIARATVGAAAALVLGFASIPANAQDTAAALYKTKCAACHGADGKGETAVGKTNKVRDLGSPEVQQQSDADLTAVIASGKGKMPAYGKSLKTDQVKDLVAYIRTLAKK